MGKKPDADPGKGGHQHRIRQERIKTAGEAKGFRSIIERSTGTGRESIDIVLLGQDLKIACEVSVLTTIDHEIGNARKCLSSGFENIFLITADDCRRTKMAAEVDAYLALGDRGKVRYFSPDEFFAYL